MADGRGVRVLILPPPGLAAIRVILEGTLRATMILDTGSNYSSISTRIAGELGLVDAQPIRRVWRTTDAGQRVPEPVHALASVALGATRVSGLEVFVSQWPGRLGVDGILGLNFFRRFHRLLFDRDRMLLTVE